MGIMVAPDIFQQKMSDLLCDKEGNRVYLDDILVMGGTSYEEHLENLQYVLKNY